STLKESIDDSARACLSLDYSRRAFESYANTFGRLFRDAQSGQITPEIEQALKDSSLIPQTASFNPDLIITQHAQRAFLKKYALRDSARLKTLADFYARQKAPIREYPSSGELREIERSLGSAPSVRIAQWTMTETNFRETDIKAVKVLAALCRKTAWNAKAAGQSLPADTVMEISSAGITLSIPFDFSETDLSFEKDREIVKSFSSQNDLSRIRIAVVPCGGITERTAADRWIEKSGGKTVKLSEGHCNAGNFVRTVSKDDHRNISENYLLMKDGVLVIISGETSHDRYPFFKERINAVFSSIR
ncbi:MAG: hypothetical protein ACRCUT_10795, partial [Spirochaetota bacterium]